MVISLATVAVSNTNLREEDPSAKFCDAEPGNTDEVED